MKMKLIGVLALVSIFVFTGCANNTPASQSVTTKTTKVSTKTKKQTAASQAKCEKVYVGMRPKADSIRVADAIGSTSARKTVLKLSRELQDDARYILKYCSEGSSAKNIREMEGLITFLHDKYGA